MPWWCWEGCSKSGGDRPPCNGPLRTRRARAVRSAVAHDKLGFVLGRQNRIREALAEFARATKLDPTLFDAQYHLGATRWWTHDLEGAFDPLATAVRSA